MLALVVAFVIFHWNVQAYYAVGVALTVCILGLLQYCFQAHDDDFDGGDRHFSLKCPGLLRRGGCPHGVQSGVAPVLLPVLAHVFF